MLPVDPDAEPTARIEEETMRTLVYGDCARCGGDGEVDETDFETGGVVGRRPCPECREAAPGA